MIWAKSTVYITIPYWSVRIHSDTIRSGFRQHLAFRRSRIRRDSVKMPSDCGRRTYRFRVDRSRFLCDPDTIPLTCHVSAPGFQCTLNFPFRHYVWFFVDHSCQHQSKIKLLPSRQHQVVGQAPVFKNHHLVSCWSRLKPPPQPARQLFSINQK